MLRERLFGQWSVTDRSDGVYVQVRPTDVLVFDVEGMEPKARIDYNEAAGVIVDEGVRKILVGCKYVSGELHLRVDEKKGKRMYVSRTSQGFVSITAQKPL